MTLGLVLKIGGALLALVWGVWMGLPGRYTQSAADIEKLMDAGGGQRRTAKRVFTPLEWVQRQTEGRLLRRPRGGTGRGFKLQAPKDR